MYVEGWRLLRRARGASRLLVMPESTCERAVSARFFLFTFQIIILTFAAGCAKEEPAKGNTSNPENVKIDGPRPDPPDVTFIDVSAESGIDFVHENGSFGKKWLPETMGSGLAAFDYDQDGDADLFFINQRRFAGREKDYTVPESRPATSHLYKNNGSLKFADVSKSSGLDIVTFGMGAATGDLDADGDPDLIVTSLGDTMLLKNDGGVFHNIAAEAGLSTPRWKDASGAEHPMWGTAAALLDYNNDGVLDLFVAAYVKWSPETDIFATFDGKTKVFTTPDLYPGDSCRLYQGAAGCKFTDVTEAAGILNTNGKSLGAAVCDVDSNGRPDIIVANDTQPNFLYVNENGRFRDVATRAGIAYDESGRARAGMGIDTAKLDATTNNLSVAIGNFSREPLSFFVDHGKNQFSDETGAAGLAAATFAMLTFGLIFTDIDLDGRLDLAIANGHIEPSIEATFPEVTYAERPQIFWNGGRGKYYELPSSLTLAPAVGRGLVARDLDGDGDSEIVISQNGGRAVLLRCDRGPKTLQNNFIQIKLQGRGERDALGAVVRVSFGGRAEERTVKTGSSYLSQSDTMLTFGLGAATQADKIEITWRDGEKKVLEHVVASKQIMLIKQ